MAARQRPNSVEYGNSKTTVHCCLRLNVRVHSSKVELTAAGLCVFGGLWVDMWRLVQQRWFLLFWRSLDCFWRLVHCWYTVGTVLVDLWRLVPYTNDFECFWRLVQCTIRQKQSKDSQKSKNHHWCNNRHMSSQSPPNTQSRANAATSRDLHHMCLGSGHSPSSVDRADSMCLHGRPCVWLPFAAVCCYTLFYLLMMSSLSTTVIKFSIFSDPTRKVSPLPPELRRIR